MPRRPSAEDQAQKLYEAIASAVSSMHYAQALKLVSFINNNEPWADMPAPLRNVFVRVVEEVTL